MTSSKPKHPGGRPQKMTEKMRGEILIVISMCGDKNRACQFVGIHRRTLDLWLQKGAKASEMEPEEVAEKELQEYLEFFLQFRRAIMGLSIKAYGVVNGRLNQNCIDTAKWWLERKEPSFRRDAPLIQIDVGEKKQQSAIEIIDEIEEIKKSLPIVVDEEEE